MTTTMSAKINMQAPQIDGSTAVARAGSIATAITGAVTPAMTRGVSPVPMTGATGVASRVVSSATSILTGAMTGSVSIPVTGGATGVTMRVTSLHTGGSEHGKADSDGQDGDEFFHKVDSLIFGYWPHKSGTNIRRGDHQSIQPTSILFHL